MLDDSTRVWEAQTLARAQLTWSSAGQSVLGSLRLPGMLGAFASKSQCQMWRGRPGVARERVKVGLGSGCVQGAQLSAFFLRGEPYSELGEAAESPSSGSCPWGEMG